jgi:hypothetical protein
MYEYVVKARLAAAGHCRSDRNTQPTDCAMLQLCTQCLKICNTKMGNQNQSAMSPSLPATVKWHTSFWTHTKKAKHYGRAFNDTMLDQLQMSRRRNKTRPDVVENCRSVIWGDIPVFYLRCCVKPRKRYIRPRFEPKTSHAWFQNMNVVTGAANTLSVLYYH